MRTRNILPLLLALALSVGIPARAQVEPNGLPPELHHLLKIVAERSLAKSEKAKKFLTNDLSIASLSLLREVLTRRPLPNSATPQEDLPSPASPSGKEEDEAPSVLEEVEGQSLPSSSSQNPVPQEGQISPGERPADLQADSIRRRPTAGRLLRTRRLEQEKAETFASETGSEAAPAPDVSRSSRPTQKAPQAARIRDERLVGRWQRMEYKAGSVASVTRYYTAVLHTDGRGSFSENSETGFGGDLRGGSQSDSALTGRWSTSGSRLTVELANEDPETYQYELRGNGTGGIVLRLRPVDGGSLQEWSLIQ